MNTRLTALAQALRNAMHNSLSKGLRPLASRLRSLAAPPHPTVRRWALPLLLGAVAATGAVVLVRHPVWQSVPQGDMGLRSTIFGDTLTAFGSGPVLVLPGVHTLRVLPMRDQIYHPTQGRRADGEAPFQSIEGLSLGVDLSVRYALDPSRVLALANRLPTDIGSEVVQPEVQGVIYKVFTRYTVREIYSSKRAEIQQAIEAELRGKLAADGILLRGVQIGKVDLPADYRQGMDQLLAEELASEKMRYTLELKEKGVKATELEAQADKVRRETSAAAAASEQIIAARAQEDAMKHVLPFKQKQIEQRQLEAEADKVTRIKAAEATAQSRRIEAAGEADSRQKLADAEGYRMELVGKIASAQMERDGALLSRHPLLIQKTVADKLSDKISVIIAPPGTDGHFIAASLIGGGGAATAASPAAAADSSTTTATANATTQKEVE